VELWDPFWWAVPDCPNDANRGGAYIIGGGAVNVSTDDTTTIARLNVEEAKPEARLYRKQGRTAGAELQHVN
jgi:hypothetical protein